LNRLGSPNGALFWFLGDQEDRFMPAALSSDIRHRFQVLHREGLSAREIGRRLLISAATAVRFADGLRRTGNLRPKANPRRRGHCRLVLYEGFFAELVEQDPDIILKELQAALLDAHSVQASLSGIDVVLKRLDLTYKKRASSRTSGANPM
jgi:transposase